mgnify:CR=1 FL=1
MCIRDSCFVDVRDQLQCIAYLVGIVLHQLLGSEARSRMQRGLAHSANIAVNALVEREQKAMVVMPGAVRAQAIEPGTDCHVIVPVSYTHLRAHETVLDIVCRLLLEKKKTQNTTLTTQ